MPCYNNEKDDGYVKAIKKIQEAEKYIPKYICCPGPQGPVGPEGPEGPQGPKGECDCKCKSKGELIKNGGFEETTDNKPNNWILTNSSGVTSETGNGRVHSGNKSVNVKNTSKISQTITDINEDCYYELSFFLNSDGDTTGLTVTVTFITTSGSVIGGTVNIREQDIVGSSSNFGYYKLITSKAPSGTTSLKVEFCITANGEQSINIDDVSLTVK